MKSMTMVLVIGLAILLVGCGDAAEKEEAGSVEGGAQGAEEQTPKAEEQIPESAAGESEQPDLSGEWAVDFELLKESILDHSMKDTGTKPGTPEFDAARAAAEKKTKPFLAVLSKMAIRFEPDGVCQMTGMGKETRATYSLEGNTVTLISAEESDPRLTFTLTDDALNGSLPVPPSGTLPIVFRRR